MSKVKTPAQMRYTEIDYILRDKEQPEERTLEAILAHLKSAVPNPRKGSNGSWGYETFNNDKKEMRKAYSNAEIICKNYTDNLGERIYYYEYKDPNFEWPEVDCDSRMYRALQLARAILKPYEKLPAVKDISNYAKNIEKRIYPKGEQPRNVPIYFSAVADVDIKNEIWEPVLEAATERRMLEITYKAGWDGTTRTKKIKPYSIICLEGEWYICGTRSSTVHANTPDELWQHKISRIKKAEVLPYPFTLPKNFDVVDALNHTLGKFVGNSSRQTVRVLLKNRVAALAAQGKFHPKQKWPLETTDDGVIIEFDVSDAGEWPFYNVIRWVLSWGRDAEVLDPPDLKKLVSAEIKMMAKIV